MPMVVAEGVGFALDWRRQASWKRARRRNPAAGPGIPERRRGVTTPCRPSPSIPDSSTPTIVQTGNAIASGFGWSSELGPFGLPRVLV